MPKKQRPPLVLAFNRQGLTHFEKLIFVSLAFAKEHVPDERLGIGTLSRLSSMSCSAVKKKIRKLEEYGLVKIDRDGDDVRYSINWENVK